MLKEFEPESMIYLGKGMRIRKPEAPGNNTVQKQRIFKTVDFVYALHYHEIIIVRRLVIEIILSQTILYYVKKVDVFPK